MLRAYAKYLKQTGFTFSQAYIEQTLAAHPGDRRASSWRSSTRASIRRARTTARARSRSSGEAIKAALNDVANADEDRILRRFLHADPRHACAPTTGCAAPRARASPSSRSSCDSAQVPELPDPRPLFEIYVYSPRFEAIHLRGGKVARGGLRWSRPPRGLPHRGAGPDEGADGEERGHRAGGLQGRLRAEERAAGVRARGLPEGGVACYQEFLRGLLDVTDNLVGGKVVPPPDVVRHDADDPVPGGGRRQGHGAPSPTSPTRLRASTASGSATRSPPAAAPATTTRRWASPRGRLGERQAPLPRDGHRHADRRTSPWSGIGDMSGDVFGNGMLLSRHIKLVAAFDHRHIFLDPTPTPRRASASASACSRCRARPGTTTTRKLISQGRRRLRRAAPSRSRSRRRCASVLDIDGDRAHAARS